MKAEKEKAVKTILTIEWPFQKIPGMSRTDKFFRCLPRRERWFGWLISWGGGSVQEFGTGCRVNRQTHIKVFRYHVLAIRRNEYRDRSDEERAAEYLRKWSACEKELQMFRLAALGEGVSDDVKKVIKESLGVDLDEGTFR